MAIKILFEGKDPKETKYKGTCYECKTIVECLKEDGEFYISPDQRDPPCINVPCPVCSKKSIISCYAVKD